MQYLLIITARRINNMNTIPIFVINLPKDKDRKIFMERQLDKLKASYVIVEARYGKDDDVIAGCNDELSIKEHGKVLMAGEKGCAFSHRFIYETIVREQIPCAVILEDDVVLPDDFLEIIEKEVSKKNRTWDWLSFDYPKIGFSFVKAWIIASEKMVKKNKIFFFYAFIKAPIIISMSLFEILRDKIAKGLPFFRGPKLFYRPLYNAGAYLVTQEGVKKLIPLLYPIRFSADRTPNQARLKTGLRMRWYVPRIVHQTDEDTGNIFMSNTIN